MASTVPTPATLTRKVKLCWLALFDPEQFEKLEELDDEQLNKQSSPSPRQGIRAVRKSYSAAALWGLSAIAAGILIGLVIEALHKPTTSPLGVAIAGCVGAAVLLWATLALKGWEIQTHGGVTLTERVNRWYFRGLCWVGTMLIAMAATWGVD